MGRREAALEAALLLNDSSTERELSKLKVELAKKHGLSGTIRNSEILAVLPEEKKTRMMLALLKKRPVRTVSGVAPVAVMTSSGCPHGRCTYCPKGEGAPNAYTGREPASMRGKQFGFDAFLQARQRLAQLQAIGHSTEKVDLIIQGGTFASMPKEYKDNFVKGCFDALNGGSERAASLSEAQERNERAENRCVGLTIETRPDWCREEHVDEFISWGATRVELGVQALSDEVYRKVKRCHSVADVARATRVLKDSSLKVLYHMMPGLWQGKEKDVADFKRLFEDPQFKPDMLKIYPCLVLEGTELYEDWKKGDYKPYSTEEAADVIAEALQFVPPYCRIMRITRDIPVQLIADGVKKNNLRQIAEKKAGERGIRCRCIRCREVGLKKLKEGIEFRWEDFSLKRLDYEASGGKEVFLSFEDETRDALAAFLRLRVPGSPHRKEIGPDDSLVRELHAYGTALPIGGKEDEEAQHQGFGTRLLEEAERIAKEEFDRSRMVVLPGIGVREYYFKRGYKKEGSFVSKKLLVG